MGNDKKKKEFVCYDCFKLKKCKEPATSWIFFFIALIATISIRAVNLALNFSAVWAKIFWYVGIGGFFIFFIYKYKHNNIMQKELSKSRLADKLLSKSELSEHDYEILGTIICKLSSKKDKINFFFIFLFSGIALSLAIYADFFK